MKEKKEYLRYVEELKRKDESKNKNIIFLCIGSNKIIGDSLGPMVGSRLKKMKFNKRVEILGDIENPITAQNVQKAVNTINKNSYIVVIDSALSFYSDNKIFITKEKMILGSGIGKEIIDIGNLGIKVSIAKFNNNVIENFKKLEEANIYTVNKLAKIVSKGIYQVFGN